MAEKKNAKKIVVHEACVEVNHDDKKCPIKEYLENRAEKLEKDIDASLNPLDRLEFICRHDELDRIRHFMLEHAVEGFLDMLEKKSKEDSKDENEA